MKPKMMCFFAVCLLAAAPALAQQAQQFGEYTVHFNALSTSQLSPQVAQTYGIQRSSNRALLNVTVLREADEGVLGAIPARVEANARNLTGQYREIEMRKIEESDDAIYYIGEFRINHMETFDFTVNVLPQGSADELVVRFRQQFFTE